MCYEKVRNSWVTEIFSLLTCSLQPLWCSKKVQEFINYSNVSLSLPPPSASPSETGWPMTRACHLSFIFHAEIPSAHNISVTWYIRDVFNSKAATWLKAVRLSTHMRSSTHTHLITQSDYWVQHLIFNKCGCLRSILQSNRSSLNLGVFTA